MSGHYVQSSSCLYVPCVTAYAIGQSFLQALCFGKQAETDITCIETDFNRCVLGALYVLEIANRAALIDAMCERETCGNSATK